jgi:hypothetical protein
MSARYDGLAESYDDVIDAGLSLDRVYEPREHPIPSILAIRATR